MLSKEGTNLLENVDYAEGESKAVTNFLETDCDKCGNKIKFKLAIGDIKNVEEYIEKLESEKQKLIKKLEEDIELARKEYRVTLSDRQDGIRHEAQEILSILKGES